MERYYNAGYYLIKKHPIDFGIDNGKIVATCSGCINITAFDFWALCWTMQLDNKDKSELGLNDQSIKQIQEWTEKRFYDGRIGYGNVFPDLKMALEFKDLFYKDRPEIEILAIDFSETETNNLIEDFAPGENAGFNFNNGVFGLRDNLLKKNYETADTISDFLGFDFIGVECDGTFHSFYCHDITKELIDKFGLTLNEHGLFESIPDSDLIRDYLNSQETGLEPVPWYIVKVKKIRNASN